MTRGCNEVQLLVSFMLINVHVWLILVTGIFRNFCTEREELLSFRTKIPDGPVASLCWAPPMLICINPFWFSIIN